VRPKTFDLYEVLLITGLVAIGTAAVFYRPAYRSPYGEQESPAAYQARFHTKWSENAEEWLIRDFFDDRTGGVFLDVGAGHFRDGSNTYFLETALGWTGLAIDAQEEYGADYPTFRPNSRFLAAFVTDAMAGPAELFVPTSNRKLASGDGAYVEQTVGVDAVREVPTITLDAALEQAAIDRIDFLSLDIELHEPQALAGFDIDRYRPSLVCVEAHLPVRDQLLAYFHAHDYVVVGKYLRVDDVNLYFTPAITHQP